MIEILKRPLPCNHRSICLPLFLLPDLEINERATIWRLPNLQVLPVSVALVYPVNGHEHGDAWCDEVPRREVNYERLLSVGNRDEGLDDCVSVDSSELW